MCHLILVTVLQKFNPNLNLNFGFTFWKTIPRWWITPVALKTKLVFILKYRCQCCQNHISSNKDLCMSYVWSFGCFIFLSNGSVIKHRKHNIIWPLERTMEWWERSHIGQAIGERAYDFWSLTLIYYTRQKLLPFFLEISHHHVVFWKFYKSSDSDT